MSKKSYLFNLDIGQMAWRLRITVLVLHSSRDQAIEPTGTKDMFSTPVAIEIHMRPGLYWPTPPKSGEDGDLPRESDSSCYLNFITTRRVCQRRGDMVSSGS